MIVIYVLFGCWGCSIEIVSQSFLVSWLTSMTVLKICVNAVGKHNLFKYKYIFFLLLTLDILNVTDCLLEYSWEQETFSFLPDVPSFNLCTFLLWSLFFFSSSSDLYIKLKPSRLDQSFQWILPSITLSFSSLLFLSYFYFFCILPIFVPCAFPLSFSSMEIVKAHNVVPSIHSQWTISAVRLLKVDSSSQE